MFETITKGFLIGLLVSAPMGPINMLTIQRTLNRGRWHGFMTGLGATLSDLVYALITLVGLSFVADFFDEYEQIIQILGSVILFFFGLRVFQSNPLRDWTPNKLPQETRYLKDFVSSFLLTFSNVAIILVLIGLYARFSFNPLADGKTFFVAGLIAFTAALFIWWFLLTTMVSRLRKHFNRRGLVLLNRSVGTLLMLLGLGGIILLLFPGFF
ncbi:Threonine/homoserine/homoserine lactone efflux protein [Porphyromonadaceae bacterium KH3R12]|uniref:LysE family translocator n=1 Tax=Proteiniphilum TaxID=294702 RepID=UPI0008992A56|nr:MULTISPECIES: LysE family translocator [Proteiniphilum]MDY9919449.1 LysE family translocator [Proteiniphilum sp.]SEA02990.1 Threonine/homoserine/homoserine lactone efflux protein [Porphyromonadaceae bacterium KH3R12]